jgi:hypothetical protein
MKLDRYSFSNGWAICHWIRYLKVFPYPLHIWNLKRKWHRWNFFYPVWFSWLLDGWSIFWAKPEATQFKTLDVIHLRYGHTDRDDRSNTQIHSWMNLRKKSKMAGGRRSAAILDFFEITITFTVWPIDLKFGPPSRAMIFDFQILLKSMMAESWFFSVRRFQHWRQVTTP